MDQLSYGVTTTNIITKIPSEFGKLTNRPTINPTLTLTNGVQTSAFPSAAINDTYQSQTILVNQPGTYSIYVYVLTNGFCAKATFDVKNKYTPYGGNSEYSFGEIDLYSLSTTLSVLKFSNIVLEYAGGIYLQYVVTGKNGLSSGYNVNLSDIVLVKE